MSRSSSSRQTNSNKVKLPKIVTPPPPLKSHQSFSTSSNGFMENIKQGFAFGTGSALSRVFIDKFFGVNNRNAQTNINMEEISKKYFECINYSSNPEESEKCEIYKKYLQ